VAFWHCELIEVLSFKVEGTELRTIFVVFNLCFVGDRDCIKLGMSFQGLLRS